MSALNYNITDIETGITLISETIDYADHAEYELNIEKSDSAFAAEKCFDEASVFQIFAAKYLPDLDQHELNNEFVNECFDDNFDHQSKHVKRRGNGRFDVCLFGRVIKCELTKDRW